MEVEESVLTVVGNPEMHLLGVRSFAAGSGKAMLRRLGEYHDAMLSWAGQSLGYHSKQEYGRGWLLVQLRAR